MAQIWRKNPVYIENQNHEILYTAINACDVSRRSIQRRLKQLVDDGYLELIGETHDAKYVLKQRKN